MFLFAHHGQLCLGIWGGAYFNVALLSNLYVLCRLTQVDDNLLVRQALHVQKELLVNNCSSWWLYKLKNTLSSTKFGLEIWNKWFSVDKFRIDCFLTFSSLSPCSQGGEVQQKRNGRMNFLKSMHLIQIIFGGKILLKLGLIRIHTMLVNKNSYNVSESFKSTCTRDNNVRHLHVNNNNKLRTYVLFKSETLYVWNHI